MELTRSPAPGLALHMVSAILAPVRPSVAAEQAAKQFNISPARRNKIAVTKLSEK